MNLINAAMLGTFDRILTPYIKDEKIRKEAVEKLVKGVRGGSNIGTLTVDKDRFSGFTISMDVAVEIIAPK